MTRPQCCPKHTTACGHLEVCCPACPTERENTIGLYAMLVLVIALVVLLAIALPAGPV